MSARSVDLSGFVTGAFDIKLDPWQRSMLERLPTGSITIDFRASARWGECQVHRARRAARQQRLSRMRTAYHRRRR